MTNTLSFSLTYRSNLGRSTFIFRMLDKLVLFAFLLVLILLSVIYYSKQLLTSFYLAGQLKNLLDSKIREQQQLLLQLRRQNATTQCNIDHGLEMSHTRSSPNVLSTTVPLPRTNTSGHTHHTRFAESSNFSANRQRFPRSQLRPSQNLRPFRNLGSHGGPNLRATNNNGETCQLRPSNRPPRYSAVCPTRNRSRNQQDTNENSTPGNPLRDITRDQGTDAGILLIMGDVTRESSIHDSNEQEDTGSGETMRESISLGIPS